MADLRSFDMSVVHVLQKTRDAYARHNIHLNTRGAGAGQSNSWPPVTGREGQKMEESFEE